MLLPWVILAVLSAFLAALVSIFCKLGLDHIDNVLAETIRTLILLLFFTVMSFSMGKFDGLRMIDGKALCFVLLSGVCGAFSWLVYLGALRMGPVSKVVALEPLSIVFVVFLATLMGEPLTAKTLLAALLIASGAMLIAI